MVFIGNNSIALRVELSSLEAIVPFVAVTSILDRFVVTVSGDPVAAVVVLSTVEPPIAM